jgi:ParB family chromosome partitioning protein
MSNGIDKTRRPLGKGLSSLLPPRSARPAVPVAEEAAATQPARENPLTLPITSIAANPLQPRTVFQPERLEELAASIRANGIIQPIIVRRVGQEYQIVAGERRWRAAKLAGLANVPAVVADVADASMLELALIENIQREDLNPIELAQAYDRMHKELGLSHEQIGERTGKDRSSIANALRLLRLPAEVQRLLAEHRLSTGHARAILGLAAADDQIQLAEKAAAQGLSVRQVETLVQEATSHRTPKHSGPKRESDQDPNVRAAIEQLERALGTRVRIVELSDQRGRIEIDYFSQEELDRVFQQLAGQ